MVVSNCTYSEAKSLETTATTSPQRDENIKMFKECLGFGQPDSLERCATRLGWFKFMFKVALAVLAVAYPVNTAIKLISFREVGWGETFRNLGLILVLRCLLQAAVHEADKFKHFHREFRVAEGLISEATSLEETEESAQRLGNVFPRVSFSDWALYLDGLLGIHRGRRA